MSTDYIQALETENAALRETLRDLRYGAHLMSTTGATGAFLSYAREVKRVAEAALNNTNTTEITHNV